MGRVRKNRQKRTPNKKGQWLGGVLVDAYAYIVFILILLLFFFLFKLDSSYRKFTIEQPKIQLASNQAMAAYLGTPVTVDDKEMTMADLIVLWDVDPYNYGDKLKEESAAFLSRIQVDDDVCSYININKIFSFRSDEENCEPAVELLQDPKQIVSGVISQQEKDAREKEFASISEQFKALLPSLDPNKPPIKLYLYSGLSRK